MYEKKIFITGTSSGFGKLTIPLLIRKNYLIISAIRGGEARLRDTFKYDENHTLVLRALENKQLFAIDLELTDSTSLANAIDQVKSITQGKLDVLINNAGYGILSPVEAQSFESIKKQFEVNFFAPLKLILDLLPLLKKSRGKIINISSIVGLISFPFYGVYAATKHSMNATSEALFNELKKFGVQTTLIEPGGFKTDFVNKTLLDKHVGGLEYDNEINNFKKFLQKKSAAGGNPLKVAELILHIIESKKIKCHYIVGFDAKLINIVKRLLPNELRLKITGFFFKKIVS